MKGALTRRYRSYWRDKNHYTANEKRPRSLQGEPTSIAMTDRVSWDILARRVFLIPGVIASPNVKGWVVELQPFIESRWGRVFQVVFVVDEL